jgi:hypothetical protein
MINVVEMLRPLLAADRAKADEALGDLAARIVTGASLTPQEISAGLDRLKATPEALQAEIERQERILELRETIKTGKGARRRLQAINDELDRAKAAADAAQAMSEEIHSQYRQEWTVMRDAVQAADDAAHALIRPEYLSTGDKARLDAINFEMLADTKALESLRDTIPRIRQLVEEADMQLAALAEASTASRENARRTLEARRERLKAAEAEVAKITEENAGRERQQQAIYDAIRKAAGA